MSSSDLESNVIEVTGSVQFTPPATGNDAHQCVRQVARDAVFGTFDDFPEDYWKSRMTVSFESLDQLFDVEPRETGYSFTIRLPADQFSASRCGFQHLVGVLAGDLFIAKFGARDVKWGVESVRLPVSMETEAQTSYLASSYSIDDIRKAFSLRPEEPLLAFTFKPRTRVSRKAFEEVTLDVLNAGFHVVELDTRNLAVDDDSINWLTDLAKRCADLGKKHVTRLSLNLSVSAPLALEIVDKLAKAHAKEPVIVKIDGGLDGLGTCQALRRSGDVQPIITSYPLLRSAFAGRVPADVFVRMLVLSGADIVYIGGRPLIADGKRDLWSSGDDLIKNTRRYWNAIKERRPMPTIAGGVYAGQLHAYYELMGPDTAYFLGGAIALHKEGPRAGAKLCRRIIDEAIELRSKAKDETFVDRLSEKLVLEVEDAYPDAKAYPYVKPSMIATKAPSARSWFARE